MGPPRRRREQHPGAGFGPAQAAGPRRDRDDPRPRLPADGPVRVGPPRHDPAGAASRGAAVQDQPAGGADAADRSRARPHRARRVARCRAARHHRRAGRHGQDSAGADAAGAARSPLPTRRRLGRPGGAGRRQWHPDRDRRGARSPDRRCRLAACAGHCPAAPRPDAGTRQRRAPAGGGGAGGRGAGTGDGIGVAARRDQPGAAPGPGRSRLPARWPGRAGGGRRRPGAGEPPRRGRIVRADGARRRPALCTVDRQLRRYRRDLPSTRRIAARATDGRGTGAGTRRRAGARGAGAALPSADHRAARRAGAPAHPACGTRLESCATQRGRTAGAAPPRRVRGRIHARVRHDGGRGRDPRRLGGHRPAGQPDRPLARDCERRRAAALRAARERARLRARTPGGIRRGVCGPQPSCARSHRLVRNPRDRCAAPESRHSRRRQPARARQRDRGVQLGARQRTGERDRHRGAHAGRAAMDLARDARLALVRRDRIARHRGAALRRARALEQRQRAHPALQDLDRRPQRGACRAGDGARVQRRLRRVQCARSGRAQFVRPGCGGRCGAGAHGRAPRAAPRVAAPRALHPRRLARARRVDADGAVGAPDRAARAGARADPRRGRGVRRQRRAIEPDGRPESRRAAHGSDRARTPAGGAHATRPRPR